jgi:hypothetical protein
MGGAQKQGANQARTQARGQTGQPAPTLKATAPIAETAMGTGEKRETSVQEQRLRLSRANDMLFKKVEATNGATPEDIPKLKQLADTLREAGLSAREGALREREKMESISEYDEALAFWLRLGAMYSMEEWLVLKRIAALAGKEDPEIKQRIQAASDNASSSFSRLGRYNEGML